MTGQADFGVVSGAVRDGTVLLVIDKLERVAEALDVDVLDLSIPSDD